MSEEATCTICSALFVRRTNGRRRLTCSRACWEAKRRRDNNAWFKNNPERGREIWREASRRRKFSKLRAEKDRIRMRQKGAKIFDLLAVLRAEMPDLLKEFGL